MAKYRVGCWRTEYGYYDIEAKDEKEATAIANEQLDDGDEFDDVSNRDMGTVNIDLLN
jgi:hypothetical protein